MLQVILMNEHVVASNTIELAVSPQAYYRIAAFLDRNGFQFTVLNEDLQK